MSDQTNASGAVTNMPGEALMSRIGELGTLISNSSAELHSLLAELQRRANQTMAESAQVYIAELPNGPVWAGFNRAQESLVDTSIAASNINELVKRSLALRSSSGYFGELFDHPRSQYAKNVRAALKIPAPATPAVDQPRHNRSR